MPFSAAIVSVASREPAWHVSALKSVSCQTSMHDLPKSTVRGNIWILILTTFKQNSGKILGGAPAPAGSSQDALTGPMDGPHWHAQLASQSRWRGMPDLESGQR